MAFSPDGSLAYVANANDTVSVIDTKTFKVFATMTIDPSTDTSGGHAIALSPNGTRVYVTDAVDSTVRVSRTRPVHEHRTRRKRRNNTRGPKTRAADSSQGVVNVRDADQDRLTYSLAEPPAMGGTVTFNQKTGAFSYTPSQKARDQAAATTVQDYDTFGVYVSDGISTTHTTVRVQVAPTPAPTTPATTSSVTVGSGRKRRRSQQRLRVRHQLRQQQPHRDRHCDKANRENP